MRPHVGYVDAEGYLYLTDRKHFMIISGGVWASMAEFGAAEVFASLRLVLRGTVESDIPALHERIFAVPEVMRYVLLGRPHTYEESIAVIRSAFNFSGSKTGFSTLEEKASGEIIGFSGLMPCRYLDRDDFEFGFVLAKDVHFLDPCSCQTFCQA